MQKLILLDSIATVETLSLGEKLLLSNKSFWGRTCFHRACITNLSAVFLKKSVTKKTLAALEKQKRVIECKPNECRHSVHRELIVATSRSQGLYLGENSINLFSTALCHKTDLILSDTVPKKIAALLDIHLIDLP